MRLDLRTPPSPLAIIDRARPRPTPKTAVGMGAALSAWLAGACSLPPPAPQTAVEIEVELPATSPPPPTTPTTPALEDKPSEAPPAEHVTVRKAPVPTLSEFTILAYVDLVRTGVFENEGPLSGYTQGERTYYAQAEQDPLGVLTTTLWFLRCHKIADLSWKSRQSAAVVLTCFHKTATSQTTLRKLRSLTVERVVRRFLLPEEEERIQNIDELVQNHPMLEAHLAWNCDLLHFWQTSPMAGAEERLWTLLRAEELKQDAVVAIRGIVFFFIVNALLDGKFNKYFDKYSPSEFGGGVVGLSIVCGRRAWHDLDHSDDVRGVHREVAIRLLKVSRRTPAMRVAAYRDCTASRSTGRCVTTQTLDAVAASFEASDGAPRAPTPAAPAPP